jgi:hypothetical protein
VSAPLVRRSLSLAALTIHSRESPGNPDKHRARPYRSGEVAGLGCVLTRLPRAVAGPPGKEQRPEISTRGSTKPYVRTTNPAFSDDGLRVRVDGVTIVDSLVHPQVAAFDRVVQVDGPTQVLIRWYEKEGSQALNFRWKPTAS